MDQAFMDNAGMKDDREATDRGVHMNLHWRATTGISNTVGAAKFYIAKTYTLLSDEKLF